MGIVVLVVILMIVAAIAVAAGALDGPRRGFRRRVVVREPDVVVERPARSVVTERSVVTDRDPLL